MKISVKTMALLAFMTPLALASDGGHLRSNEPPFMRRQLDEKCTPPNDKDSMMVELSYYPQGTPIEVTFTDGVPDKFFKFVGCISDYTTFLFWTCGSLSERDAALGFWKRDGFEYYSRDLTLDPWKDEHCFDWDICWCGPCNSDCEIALEVVCNYDEEVYLKLEDLSGDEGEKSFTFGYTTICDEEWPCMPTATATYVHDSIDVNMNPNEEKIKAEFLFTGSMTDPTFDVIVFNDQTCTIGNELVGTVDDGGQGNPLITYDYPPLADQPFSIEINPPGTSLEDPHEVVLTPILENFAKYDGSLWVEGSGVNPGDPRVGTLKYCMQFRVDKNDDNMVEFVDVAFTITVELEADCDCTAEGARDNPDSSSRCWCPCPTNEPYCGPVTILRDEIFNEDADVDPDFAMDCGPCEGEDATVTQGDVLPVCLTLKADPWCFYDNGSNDGLTALSLTVSDANDPLAKTEYHLYPDAPETLVAGPACSSQQCVMQITIPANMISQIEAGTLSERLTGTFAGQGAVSLLTCGNARGPDDGDVVYVPFVGKPFNLDVVMRKEEDECDGRFFAKLLCRFREWLRQIRGKS